MATKLTRIKTSEQESYGAGWTEIAVASSPGSHHITLSRGLLHGFFCKTTPFKGTRKKREVQTFLDVPRWYDPLDGRALIAVSSVKSSGKVEVEIILEKETQVSICFLDYYVEPEEDE